MSGKAFALFTTIFISFGCAAANPPSPAEPGGPAPTTAQRSTTTQPAATPAPLQTPPAETDASGATADEVMEQYGRDQVGGVGDLLVAPTRLVLGPNDRSAQLSLVNIGTNPATYRIAFTELRMTESGELETLPEDDVPDSAASRIIRYSPRQVTLQPNVAQTVRLQVRKPADLPSGEYRSHLLFRAIPPPDRAEEGRGEEEAAPETGLSVRIVPIYGISIPVIVRHGEISGSVEIGEVTLQRPARAGDLPALSVRLTRHGNVSAYGHLQVIYRSSGGAEHVVGALNGIGIYTPLEHRTIQVPLTPPDGVELTGGTLEVTFREGESGTNEIRSRKTIDLP